MKLSLRIILYITAALLTLFTLWAFGFYKTSKHRIYDRIDLVLTKQSDIIIERFLGNDSLPNSLEGNSGTVEFFIEKVSPEYALTHQEPTFQTNDEYIDDIQRDETVRVLSRVFKKKKVDYELTLTTQVFAWNDTLDFAIVSIIALAIVLLITIIMIVSFIIISNMMPLYRLTDWLRNRKVNEDVPLPDSSIKAQEFKEIELAVLESSEKSKQIFEEQQRFIGNASHEIQTPLAICRNRLELLVDNTKLDEQQLLEIQKTLDTLNYISRLNKSLLLLSKIENHQFDESVEIDLKNLMEQTLENLSEIYASTNIKVSISGARHLIAHMDQVLASSLVTNLLKNAFVHNRPDGEINIEIAPNTLTIRNTGVEEALDANAIFNIFYKKGENANSSGLGLPIAKAICDEYNIGISYQFSDNQHCFSVAIK